MPKSLYDVLSKKPHRETVGASTAARFDYQKSYALFELINRHTTDVDYAVAFEFHDDILFFDSEANPSVVEFTQVKTSSSNLPKKTHTLTSRRGNSNSVLGKLIMNMDGIPMNHEVSLVVVSNNPFEFTNTDVNFKNLDDATKLKISSKLKEEFEGLKDDVLGSFNFKVTNIAIENMDTHLRGRVVDLFEKEFGSKYSQNVLSWLRLIAGEIKRKNNYPPENITTAEELIEQKCIGRSLITGSLESLKADHNPAPDLAQINMMLMSQGWSDNNLLRFSKAFPIAVSDYQDPTNTECQELCEKIGDEIDSLSNPDEQLTKLITSVRNILEQELENLEPYQNQMYLSSLITVVFYAKL